MTVQAQMNLVKSRFLFIIIFVSLSHCVKGQENSISGTIVTEDGPGLGYVNILLEQGDSAVAGAMSDSSGYFHVSVPNGTYTLTAKTWGYDALSQQVDAQNNLNLGKLTMSIAADITQIEITARKPLVVREIDRLRVKVPNTILADGDAWEMLRLAPGIMVTQKGDIRMQGKAGIRVMIDGRDINISGQDLMDMLSGMSAQEVESIEIISNPPASFSASGAGVVNIIMKKASQEGLRGNVRSRFERGVYGRSSNGLSLTYKHKKLYLNGSYDLSFGKRFSNEISDMRFCNSQNDCSFWNEDSKQNSQYLKHGFHFYGDYRPGPKSRISFRTDGNLTPLNSTGSDGLTKVTGSAGLLDSSIVNENKAASLGNYQSFFLGYKQEMDKGSWNLQADYTRFFKGLSQDIFSQFVHPSGQILGRSDFRFDSDQNVDILGSQFDLSYPVSNLGAFDAGLKLSLIQTANNLDHFLLENGVSTRDETRSNQFKYDEQNAAAYLSWRKGWEQFEFKLGLRSEYTQLKGESKTGGQSLDTQYLRWFPTLHLQFFPSEKNIWGLTYGTRINRPSYRYLNAFRMYSSPYSYIEGNPFLQPAIIRNLELSLVRSNQYFFTAFASHTQNPITQMSIQDNEESTIRYFAVNQDIDFRAGISASGSIDFFSWWSAYWDLSAYYQRYQFKAPVTGEDILNSGIAFDPFIWTGFYPGKLDGLSIEFQFTYYAPRYQGSFRVDSRSEFALGLKKKFFKDRISASFFLADIFDDNKFTLRSKYSTQDHVYREDPENQYFRIGLTWNFGNRKVKNKKEQKSNTEEKQRL